MKVVFHLSQIRADEVRKALRNIENLREENSDAEIHAVSNTSAVTMAKQGSQFEDKIKKLIDEKNVVFNACANSIRETDMERDDLIENVEVVSSGVSELADLQSEEFGYIKP